MQTAREQLQEQVRRVAEARRNLTAMQNVVIEKRKAFEEAVRSDLAATQSAMLLADQAEAALRALVLADFEQTGDKKPVEGVEVKSFETLSYDATDAFAWAKQTGMAVTPEALDVKAFEKIAKATKLDFVNVVVEPKVTIARDLSAVLESNNAPVQQAAA